MQLRVTGEMPLLDVVGKVVARVLQDRLQKLAEDELPESQCGFRKNRSCADMIFTVRQLVEKSWEHKSKAFFPFIFRRYTRNAREVNITECQFADDGALLASTRAEKAVRVYQQTSNDFGLTVSIPKTKLMVTGRIVEEPIAINGGGIGAVEEFPYLGSLVASSGRVDVDVDKRVAQASRAFGALRKAVFSR